jgi:GntR family transcriptional repressor for pyruvate dehydrogenase complex
MTVARARLSDGAAAQVRRLIEQRALGPGDRLPSERDLARELGLARTSVREGLRTLELLGFIAVVPGKGIFLKDGVSGSLGRVLRTWAAVHGGALREVYEARAALEIEAAALAAARTSSEATAAMEQALAAMGSAKDRGDVEGYVEADAAFHDALARASGNGVIRQLLGAIARETLAYRLTTARFGATMLEPSFGGHRPVLDAVLAKAPGPARRAMRRHMAHAMLSVEEADDLDAGGEGGGR